MPRNDGDKAELVFDIITVNKKKRKVTMLRVVPVKTENSHIKKGDGGMVDICTESVVRIIGNTRCTRRIFDRLGLVCNQAYAPFGFRLAHDEISLSNAHYCEILRSMEVAAILGANQIIVHPLTPTDARSVFEVNIERFG